MHVWPLVQEDPTRHSNEAAHHHSWACAPAPTAATEAWGPRACKHGEGAPVLDCWPTGLSPRSATRSHCGEARRQHNRRAASAHRSRAGAHAATKAPRSQDKQTDNSARTLHHCRKAAGISEAQSTKSQYTSSDNNVELTDVLKWCTEKHKGIKEYIFMELILWYFLVYRKGFSIFLELHYKGKTHRGKKIHTEFSHLMTRYHYDRYKGNSEMVIR